MSDLIRRSDAIEVAYQLRHKPNDDEWNDEWLRSLNAIPTIDAVSVVRCGECKKLRDCRGDDWERDVIESGYVGWCNRTSKLGEADYVKADDFCSYGERSDNGKDIQSTDE